MENSITEMRKMLNCSPKNIETFMSYFGKYFSHGMEVIAFHEKNIDNNIGVITGTNYFNDICEISIPSKYMDLKAKLDEKSIDYRFEMDFMRQKGLLDSTQFSVHVRYVKPVLYPFETISEWICKNGAWINPAYHILELLNILEHKPNFDNQPYDRTDVHKYEDENVIQFIIIRNEITLVINKLDNNILLFHKGESVRLSLHEWQKIISTLNIFQIDYSNFIVNNMAINKKQFTDKK